MTQISTALTVYQIPPLVFFANDIFAVSGILQWWFQHHDIKFSPNPIDLQKSNIYSIILDPWVRMDILANPYYRVSQKLYLISQNIENTLQDTQNNQIKYILVILEDRDRSKQPYQRIRYHGFMFNRERKVTTYLFTPVEYFDFSFQVFSSQGSGLSPDEIAKFLSISHPLSDGVKSALKGFADDVL